MVRRGPNSQCGKAASTRSALKHGLRSEEAIIPGESPHDWRRHLDGVFQSCQPEGYLEQEIARLIALGLWRRRRLERYEVQSIAAHIGSAEEDLQIAQAFADRTLSRGELPAVPTARVQASRRRRVLPPDADLDKIMRYRAAEHRQLLQLMHEFEALQARRRGERSPLARFDFTASPAQ